MLLAAYEFLVANPLLLGGICVVIAYWLMQPQSTLPKGPRGWPILGNIPLLASSTAAETLASMKKTYGSVLHLQMGSVPFLFLQDHRVVKEAFVDKTDSTSDRPLFATALIRLSKGKLRGIFLNQGETHRHMRRFTLLALRDFGVGKQAIEEKITEEADAIIDVIVKQTEPYDSETFRLVCQRGVSNIIMNIVFGQRMEYNDPEFLQLQKQLMKFFSIPILGQPVNFIPWLKYVPFFPNRVDEFVACQAAVIQIIENKMEDHRKTFDPSNIRDFTDAFLKNEMSTGSDAIEKESLLRTIVDLFSAGSETTANALTWIAFFMASFPEVQKKVQNLIDKVIGSGRKPTYADRHEMPYVDAVFNEIMRLACIAPFTPPHVVSSDITIDKFQVPKNTVLVANIHALHMDKEYWGDPEVFRPERFLNEDNTIVKHSSFMPFSAGRRVCIGEQLARMEMFIFLCNFLQQLDFKFPPGHKTGVLPKGVQGLVRRPALYDVLIARRTFAN